MTLRVRHDSLFLGQASRFIYFVRAKKKIVKKNKNWKKKCLRGKEPKKIREDTWTLKEENKEKNSSKEQEGEKVRATDNNKNGSKKKSNNF